MKAVIYEKYGSPDVLKLRDIDEPSVVENDILVKVVYSAATTADIMMLTGKPYFSRLFMGLKKPKCEIIGTGFAGTVVSVGKNVTKFKNRPI